MKRERVDVLLVERGLCASREQAQAFVLAGEVWSAGQRLEKPGAKIPVDTVIEVLARAPRFVSRGGEKLESALERFQIDVTGVECLDVGSSTGGFIDCLLQRGAKRVFGVDVGYGQLDAKLRRDPRVVCREKLNARTLRRDDVLEGGAAIALVTIDVSFISLEKILPNLVGQFPEAPKWICLFKPQFELEPKAIGKKGIVREPERVPEAIAAFSERIAGLGLAAVGSAIESPIAGKKSGNLEYLVHYSRISR